MNAARNKVNEQILSKKSLLCVGLDSDPDKIPEIFHSMQKPVLEFNRAVVRATREHAVAYKLNMAFYESRGIEGLLDMQSTLENLPSESLSIADAKRADIGNTSRKYAEAFFDHWGFDALTVAPYMGEDSLEPFFDYDQKLIFVLCLTSNPGSADFEEQQLQSGTSLYQAVLSKVQRWERNGNAGIVVGATKSSQLREIRKAAPGLFFLIPGVGAQGGSLQESAAFGVDENSQAALINVSRGIIYPEGSFDSIESFEDAVSVKAARLHNEMQSIF
ncbi:MULTISPECIES: orotidine-5'-phosphate decarboxylase [Prosthecochloris]|uniref:Orotidine-5'-phosphate decarboxylase n=1 Tax=Prosthecochloris marina TaxID=2017681 RepID=A0A317T3G2_9CHLB|nr:MULTISPECIES: orotidine-5'-phosphate decarboxylase [Prosthecochloris]PWW81135.1 orotidine-5'-phosphate decarboxylase [Prosthecochloris marina]UZJ37706.1 orotidine-5'-phosphate decarboxylase [Prosthecochloris sp. SCSIO W1103]UZJ41519.1 orotidine-5'-phosphate decarboxylase [Prosthecochloris sp. SCSIO W1101]